MTALAVLSLALGLAVDAAAVSAAIGACRGPHLARAAAVFGIFQGGMALLGAGVGGLAGAAFGDWDHVLALVLLVALGARAAWNGWWAEEEDAPVFATWWELLVAGVATSVDALAAGLALPALGPPAWVSAGVVGGVTWGACLGAGAVGRALGQRLGRPVQVAGGAILALLGVQIYGSHTGWW